MTALILLIDSPQLYNMIGVGALLFFFVGIPIVFLIDFFSKPKK